MKTLSPEIFWLIFYKSMNNNLHKEHLISVIVEHLFMIFYREEQSGFKWIQKQR